MVFCNEKLHQVCIPIYVYHNPYFNRWFSAIWFSAIKMISTDNITILILIDGFLQYKYVNRKSKSDSNHNPYFNRWFSAIR